MRKIDRNPFPFAIWPDNRLQKAGERIKDPDSVEKTSALVDALKDYDGEHMLLGQEWGLGDNTFASRIGDHGAYAGSFQPDTGTLYVDWLGMNPEGNLNDPEIRQKLYDNWQKMGVREIKYSPEKDLRPIEQIPHKLWGRLTNGEMEGRDKTVNMQLPKFLDRSWTHNPDGSFTHRNGQSGTWNDVLRDSKDLGARVRTRMFDGLINGYRNHVDENGRGFGSSYPPTPTPTPTPESTSAYRPQLSRQEVTVDETKHSPRPTRTVSPWTEITRQIDPNYHSTLREIYGITNFDPESTAFAMTSPTPTPTPVQTPVKPVMPTTTPEPSASNMTMPTPTPTPVRTPVKPVMPTTISDPMPTPTPTPGGFSTPEPTPTPGGFSTPEPTPKPGGFTTPKLDGFPLPKIQPNKNWFNFAIHQAIKQP